MPTANDVDYANDAAMDAYDKIDKSDAIYIDWWEKDESHNITLDLSTSAALNDMSEVYVAASDFSWTYIVTHESTCGPYFMKIK